MALKKKDGRAVALGRCRSRKTRDNSIWITGSKKKAGTWQWEGRWAVLVWSLEGEPPVEAPLDATDAVSEWASDDVDVIRPRCKRFHFKQNVRFKFRLNQT